jgi:hypothetical protein
VHRTTTTATLLVTVAVSALSGCMTVQRPPATGPRPATPGASASALPPVPRPDGSAEPRIVQAPAREALEMVGPSREAVPPTDDAEPRRSSEPRRRAAPSPEPPHTPPRPSPRERHSGHGHDGRPPRVDLPEVEESVRGTVHRNTDVCALGRQYGGWRADSPEAQACRQVYGR